MDDKLHELLKEWSPTTPGLTGMRAGVWHRIENMEPSGWNVLLNRVLPMLSRPALATSLVAVALIAGLALGFHVSDSAQTEAYLSSLTPYRMP